MIVPRGEAVRNFLYSDTLSVLCQHARITLLSVVHDEKFVSRFRRYVENIIPLADCQERWIVTALRTLIHEAHFRWLWSEVAKNVWEIRDAKAVSARAKIKRNFIRAAVHFLGHRPILEILTSVEQYLTYALRCSNDFIELFRELKPDLIFNCSHIHGPAGELPAKIACRLGIPVAGFIFSWDNLTSRSRIFVPYDYYFVWYEGMRKQLLKIYPNIEPERVFVTGTPQFDFHFKPQFRLSRGDLCKKIGADPERPFVLYTTGIAKHFPEEHRTVELVARLLNELDLSPKPQLVVRTYVKGTSPEMKALAKQGLPRVVFPRVHWEEKWYTPMYEDLAIYSSLLRHAALGINAASTVSLELLMHDKPVINLGFDPSKTTIPHQLRWIRHIHFDHYRPVAQSGAVMVAYSGKDLATMLHDALTHPKKQSRKRLQFITSMFDGTLDGKSGKRIAQQLVALSTNHA
jgi:hypothetical protein